LTGTGETGVNRSKGDNLRAPICGAAVVTAVLSGAVAGPALADEPVAIPIRDLPPFPDIEEDVDTISEVGVYGAALAEEETVVGASKREQSLGTVASAVTVITSDSLRRYGYRTLAEAIRSVAGVYVVDDRMVERVGIRGIQLLGDANTRVLILIDGTPFNEPWSQFVDGSTALPVSLDDVARIEVIRGPVSSIYGTNAFVGIINVVTIEADKAPRGHGRTTMDTDGTFGANAAFSTGNINRQVRGAISYQYRIGESVEYPAFADGGLTSSTEADGASALTGSVAVNFDRLFFQARGYQRKRELPGAPYESEIGSDGNTDKHRHVVAEVGYAYDVTDRVSLAARLYGNSYAYVSHLDLMGGAYLSEASSFWYGGEIRALADLLPKKNLLSIITGASVEQSSTRSTASTRPDAIEKDFNIAGVYLEGTTEPRKWFALTAGARFDRNSEFTNEVSPRAAAFFRRGEDYGVKLLYAEGFRNPSIFEAYYDDDQRYSPVLDDDGATGLRPETIRAYEVVAYGRLATGVKGRVSAWDWRIDDPIISRRPLDPETLEPRVQYQNEAGGAQSRGVELETSYRDVAGRAAYGNLTIARTAKNCLEERGIFDNPTLDVGTGNCDRLENAPVYLAKLGGSSQLLFKTFHLSTELSYLSSRVTSDRDERVDGYLGWNLVWYAPNVRGFDITIGGRNLLGRQEEPAQSVYDRSADDVDVLRVPGPGPEIFARVGYQLR
jgi:iron complex outermembrane receptor protein